MTDNHGHETRLSGWRRSIARAAWLALVAPIMLAFVVGIPVRFNFLSRVITDAAADPFANLIPVPDVMAISFAGHLGPAEAEALGRLGLSMPGYAVIILAFEILLGLVCLAIGLLLFWRRSDDWLAIWFSLLLILLGMSGVSLIVPTLMTVSPVWATVNLLAGLVGMLSNVHVLFLSPDGRMAPRWALPVAAGVSGYILGVVVYVGLTHRGEFLSPLLVVIFPVWIVGLGLGVYAQLVRYRHLSTPQQRQQTKWVIIGLAMTAVGFLANGWLLSLAGGQPGLPRVLYSVGRTATVSVCMLFFPICVAFAISRYRLWDIDLIIRRTLIYSLLTGLLALTYLALVIGLQSLVTVLGGARSEWVTVASTLAVAALFAPLRNRVQAFIDRRFFRRKYDAAKTLAEFAAVARDETDLSMLTRKLAGVVRETMAPESMGIWLKPPGPGLG
jgi:hypothetical protein